MNNKVLVVEDSRTYQNYLRQQLSIAGYQVYIAGTIAEGEQLLEQHPEFRFAVLDYCLPDGQDGEVIDLFLSQGHKVVVLTATFSEQARHRFIDKGVVDYLLKDSLASVSYLIPLAKRLLNNSQHHALVVDDSSTVRHYVAQLLEHQYIKTTLAQDGKEALELLERHPDISFIITDHDMPVMDGITMIRAIRQFRDRNDLAILGLSGSENSNLTAKFLKSGANDFLTKPFNQEEFYCRVHQILDMKEATDELYKLANQDALTGLWNRRYLFSQPLDSNQQRKIAMIDIDHFKQVNDVYGHEAGDLAIKSIADILQICFPSDVVVRFGGEEFCVKSIAPSDDFLLRLENMRLRIAQTPINYQQSTINITISIGVCNDEENLEQQIRIADDRLYLAKAAGRNQTIAS